MNKAKKVGIVCRCEKDDISMLKKIMEHINDRAEVILDDRTASLIGEGERGMSIGEIDADLVICIGGDGTILKTLHLLRKNTPVVGIDMGAVGFLASVLPEKAVTTISKLLEGFRTEKRMRISVAVNDEVMPVSAINEVVVVTSRPSKMIHFSIFVDDRELERLRADGVIFATPTGSTAYAMSAGGPIVDPRMDACIIVPLAPFTLSARPSVVSMESEIKLELLDAEEAELIIDGQFYRRIEKKDEVKIGKGEDAMFVDVGEDFFSKVRNKLRMSPS